MVVVVAVVVVAAVVSATDVSMSPSLRGYVSNDMAQKCCHTAI